MYGGPAMSWLTRGTFLLKDCPVHHVRCHALASFERMLVAECYLEMAAIELFSFWCSLTQKAARAVPFTSSMIASLFRNARKNVQAAFARMQIRRAIST
jgi:hypothetical protein